MGARRVKQSNRVEYCPVCLMALNNRGAAVSHYNRHVSRLELEKVGGYYRVINADPLHRGKWDRGFAYYRGGVSLSSQRDSFLVMMWKKEKGFA